MDDFNRYLNRYCTSYKLTPEEAESHKLVQEVKLYYEKSCKKEE